MSKIPLNLQLYISEILQSLKSDPQHILSGDMRWKILDLYNSPRAEYIESYLDKIDYDFKNEDKFIPYPNMLEFSFRNIGLSDCAVYWLAILTIEHSLIIFNKNELQDSINRVTEEKTRQIILLSKKVLLEEIDFNETYQRFNAEIENSYVNFAPLVTYDVYCIYEAAANALDFILTHSAIICTEPDNTEIIESNFQDYALGAMKAYSVKDKNVPGIWTENDSKKPQSEISFDPEKRLEFWEWWLTEAIPQAWELASQTHPNRPQS